MCSGFPLSFLHFIMHQRFSVCGRLGLHADQFSTWTHSHAVTGLALSCWKKQGLPRERYCLLGSSCCFITCMYCSALMLPPQMCRLPVSCTVMHHHIITDAGFGTALITSWMVPLLFGPEKAVSVITKKNLEFWLIRPQDSFLLRLRAQALRNQKHFWVWFMVSSSACRCGCSDSVSVCIHWFLGPWAHTVMYIC